MWHMIQCLPGYMPQSFVAMVSRVLQVCLIWHMIQCLPFCMPESFVSMVSRVLQDCLMPFVAMCFRSVVGRGVSPMAHASFLWCLALSECCWTT